MDINEILNSKIGQVFTMTSGEKVKVVDGFSCYEGDYLEVIYLDDPSKKLYRISITDQRILNSHDFK